MIRALFTWTTIGLLTLVPTWTHAEIAVVAIDPATPIDPTWLPTITEITGEVAVDGLELARTAHRQGAMTRQHMKRFGTVSQLRDTGWNAYVHVDASRALETLKRAFDACVPLLVVATGPQLCADISLHLAEILLRQDGVEGARPHMRLARRLDPGRQVTRLDFSPELVAAYATQPERREHPVTIQPRDASGRSIAATVEIDGHAVIAGQSVSLDSGSHWAVVRGEGTQPRALLFELPRADAGLPVVLADDPVGLALAPGPTTDPLRSDWSRRRVRAVSLYANADQVLLLDETGSGSVHRIAGQRCELPLDRCTAAHVVDYLWPGGRQQALATLWRELKADRTNSAALAPGDPRLPAEPLRMERSAGPAPLWKRRWVWAGVAASLAATVFLWSRPSPANRQVVLRPCEFGRCPD